MCTTVTAGLGLLKSTEAVRERHAQPTHIDRYATT